MLSRAISSTRTVGRSTGDVKAAYTEASKVMRTKSPKSVPEFSASVKRWADDMDYRLGPTVVHSSSMAGLKEISPRISAASSQSKFGLDPSTAVAFAYNPTSYRGSEDFLARAMQETASEAAQQGGSPTAYLAKMPISGIRRHADLPSTWYMSSKPLRVIGSEPLLTSSGSLNSQRVEDLIATASGGMTSAQKEALRLRKAEVQRVRERVRKVAPIPDPDSVA